jgi:hypothetical protein
MVTRIIEDKKGNLWFGGAVDLAVTMVNLSLVLQQKMDYPIWEFGKFWKIKVEIFGWVQEKQVSTFTMEKHLLLIRNINTSLQRTDKQNCQLPT